jgi:hypothetical protein
MGGDVSAAGDLTYVSVRPVYQADVGWVGGNMTGNLTVTGSLSVVSVSGAVTGSTIGVDGPYFGVLWAREGLASVSIDAADARFCSVYTAGDMDDCSVSAQSLGRIFVGGQIQNGGEIHALEGRFGVRDSTGAALVTADNSATFGDALCSVG